MPNSGTKEFISHETGNQEAWICATGNQPDADGFYPLRYIRGNEMEPTIGSKWDGLYVCLKCGRIIRQDSLEIVGRNPKPKLLV
jgi:hypothetical protein